MAQICTKQHSSDLFTFDKRKKMIVGELSELSCRQTESFGQVWDDAADYGFVIVNRKKGTEACFAVSREIRSNDEDRELQVIVLVPTNETLRRHPALRGWEVHVLND
jgi:hypothetical protein